MKILIVKTSSLGDVIHSFGVLDYLKRRSSVTQIDWVVEQSCYSLIESHPLVDNTIIIDTKKWRSDFSLKEKIVHFWQVRKKLRATHYDLVFDLQGNTKSGFITFLASATHKIGFGWRSVPEILNFFVTNMHYSLSPNNNIRSDYLSLVKNYFGDSSNEDTCYGKINLEIDEDQQLSLYKMLTHQNLHAKKLVLVCYGSRWENKQLSTPSLVDFLHRFAADDDVAFIFTWADSNEQKIAINLHNHFCDNSIIAEKMSLPMLQHLMGRVDLVVAMDSLPLHLCGTTDTPSFSVFGPSSAQKYQPQGPQHHCLQGKCPEGITFDKRCARLRSCETGACLKNITGEQLYNAFYPWWRNLEVRRKNEK